MADGAPLLVIDEVGQDPVVFADTYKMKLDVFTPIPLEPDILQLLGSPLHSAQL